MIDWVNPGKISSVPICATKMAGLNRALGVMELEGETSWKKVETR